MSAENRAAFASKDQSIRQIDELIADYRSDWQDQSKWGTLPYSSYGFSKVAVFALTRALARDAKNGITINAACPGHVSHTLFTQIFQL